MTRDLAADLRHGLAFCLGLGLSGCGSMVVAPPPVSLDRLAVVTPASPQHATSEPRSPVPILQLPVAVRSVHQVRRTHGLSQQMDLSAEPGDHFGSTVTLALAAPDDPRTDARRPERPTEHGIRAELATRFPGLAMTVAPQPGRNGLGPYGLAVGRRSDGLRCLYAWQWLAGVADARGKLHDASIRLSLCRLGMGFNEMTAVMDRLTLGPVPAIGAAPGEHRIGRATTTARSRPAQTRRLQIKGKPAAPPVQISAQEPVTRHAPILSGIRFLGNAAASDLVPRSRDRLEAPAADAHVARNAFPLVPLPAR